MAPAWTRHERSRQREWEAAASTQIWCSCTDSLTWRGRSTDSRIAWYQWQRTRYKPIWDQTSLTSCLTGRAFLLSRILPDSREQVVSEKISCLKVGSLVFIRHFVWKLDKNTRHELKIFKSFWASSWALDLPRCRTKLLRELNLIFYFYFIALIMAPKVLGPWNETVKLSLTWPFLVAIF